jgi:hypothetical protein
MLFGFAPKGQKLKACRSSRTPFINMITLEEQRTEESAADDVYARMKERCSNIL